MTNCGHQNGHTVDRQGRLIACEHSGRAVSRVEHDGSRKVLASHYQGKRLNSPNDVVVKSDGSVWFTDPSYGIRKPNEGHPGETEYGDHYVFRFEPATGRLDPVVIDLVVSSTLMSMGMVMLPPVFISLPFKILLFVLVDGWNLVTRSLVESFH